MSDSTRRVTQPSKSRAIEFDGLSDPDKTEFTFGWYREFLEAILDAGFTFTSFSRGVSEGEIVLRHDVDLSPRKAAVIGGIEEELGISSTFCFLVTSPLYNLFDAPNRNILEDLSDMGHRIGLHFNSHQYWDDEPDESALVHRVKTDLNILKQGSWTPCSTVSFHCPPEWLLDRNFAEFRSTYSPPVFSELPYAADSGQRWRRTAPFDDPLISRAQILTHPGLWGRTEGHYIQRVMTELQIHQERTARNVTGELLEERFERIDYPTVDL